MGGSRSGLVAELRTGYLPLRPCINDRGDMSTNSFVPASRQSLYFYLISVASAITLCATRLVSVPCANMTSPLRLLLLHYPDHILALRGSVHSIHTPTWRPTELSKVCQRLKMSVVFDANLPPSLRRWCVGYDSCANIGPLWTPTGGVM